jgi:hypothetical protein
VELRYYVELLEVKRRNRESQKENLLYQRYLVEAIVVNVSILIFSFHQGLSNMRLVDKIEEVGLDTILRPPDGAHLLRSVGPMSQLAGRRLSSGSSSGGEGSSSKHQASSSVKPRVAGRGRNPGSQQRRDLGTVKPRASSNKEESGRSSTGGIISCLLFGRKGGLF